MNRPQKNKRSVTLIRDKLKKHLENLHIDFDNNGRPIGDYRFKFSSNRGVMTRKTISILTDIWDLVPQPEKDELWLNIKDYWHIPNDDHKAQTLADCNTQWRAYKSRLLNYMDKGQNPLKMFPYLDKDMWKDFVAKTSTVEFEEKRRKVRETVRKNKNLARVGPTGYRGMEGQWDREVESGATIKGHHISSKRARHFVFARRRRNSLGEYIISPQTEPIADEIIRKDILLSKGILEIGP